MDCGSMHTYMARKGSRGPEHQRKPLQRQKRKANISRSEPFWNRRKERFAWLRSGNRCLRWQRVFGPGTHSLCQSLGTPKQLPFHQQVPTMWQNGCEFLQIQTPQLIILATCGGAAGNSRKISPGAQTVCAHFSNRRGKQIWQVVGPCCQKAQPLRNSRYGRWSC